MNRRRLEATATYLAVVLLGALLVLSIVASADGILGWDLLPPWFENLAFLGMVALGLLTAACALASVLLNLSLIALRLAEIAARRNVE